MDIHLLPVHNAILLHTRSKAFELRDADHLQGLAFQYLFCCLRSPNYWSQSLHREPQFHAANLPEKNLISETIPEYSDHAKLQPAILLENWIPVNKEQ